MDAPPAIEVTVPCGTWFHRDPAERTWDAVWAATPEDRRPALLAWAAAHGVVPAAGPASDGAPAMTAMPGSPCEDLAGGRYFETAERPAGDGDGRRDVPPGPGGGSWRMVAAHWRGILPWLGAAVLALLMLALRRRMRRRR